MYRLPSGHAEVLLDGDSPYHTGPLATVLAGVAHAIPLLPEAYRTGGGVPYRAYGAEIRRGIAVLNRPGFLHDLADGWLATMPDVVDRLRTGSARVVDLGCGEGASTIALGRGYRRIRVLGVDLDEDSIDTARAAAATGGVADRVEFEVGDAARLAERGPFHLATIFAALHDMGDPIGVCGRYAARSPTAACCSSATIWSPADQMERLQYGFSVLHCLPATMAENPVEAAGTALRSPTVARWAAESGFSGFQRLPIEHESWQFHRIDR